MRKYTQEKCWKVVEYIIRKSNVVLEVLDARFPYQTKNSIIEARLYNLKKPFIRVITKADLVDEEKTARTAQKLKAIPFSAKTHLNTRFLIRRIMALTKKRPLRVGVVGYPNTGKSSLINALKGKKAAPVSTIANFTRGHQWIKISRNILLIDTPGVIPFKETGKARLVLKSAVTHVTDPESTALDIIEIISRQKIEEFYHIKADKDKNPEKILEAIAIKKCKLKKGGLPDLKSAGLMLINDIQKNKLRIF